MWLDLETVIHSEVSQKEKTNIINIAYMQNLEKMVQIKPTCQAENRDTGVENKVQIPRWGKRGWGEFGDKD